MKEHPLPSVTSSATPSGKCGCRGSSILLPSYPFITKYARKNGITDTNTVLECYSTDNPIIYSLVLEKTELFDVLRNRSPVLVDQIFRREAWFRVCSFTCMEKRSPHFHLWSSRFF